MSSTIPRKFIALLAAVILLPTTAFGCSNGVDSSDGDGGSDDPAVNWTAASDSSSMALIDNYWDPQQQYFYYGNQGNDDFHYWPQAHAFDVVIDAYNRTGDPEYLQVMNAWYEGVHDMNNDSWINDYYDDMQWNALAMLRAHEATRDEKYMDAVQVLWDEIKGGWTDVAGGGIMWSKPTPNSKNAISNSPASILASRLYQETGDEDYLEWAHRTYDWVRNNLVNRSTGAVWDHIEVEGGQENIRKDWIFTYNQGMFLGAALELFEITGDQMYLNDAVKAADYAMNDLTTGDRLLVSEGSGDGGLFKGILVRYLTELILEEDLAESTRNRYVAFLEHNAEALWTEGTYKSEVLFSDHWNEAPASGEEIDLTVQLSGAMLMEAMAKLDEEGLLE